jgi:hypothetical protein
MTLPLSAGHLQIINSMGPNAFEIEVQGSYSLIGAAPWQFESPTR